MARKLTHLDPLELTEAYNSGISGVALAKKFGVSPWAIFKRLREAGVEIRPDGVRKTLNLSPENFQVFREIVDGLLLGDGSISRCKPSLRIEQVNQRLGWLQDLQVQLAEIGVPSNMTPIPAKTKVIEGRKLTKTPSTVLYAPLCEEVRAERQRWYPSDIKRVPSDLILTPRVLALWLSGDGSSGGGGTLRFYTNGFMKEDVDFLVESLIDVSIHAQPQGVSRRDERVVVISRKDDALELATRVRPYLSQCCLYKLRLVREATPRGAHMRKLSDVQVQELRRLYTNSASQTELASRFGISQAAVSRIVRREVYQWVT